LRSPIVWFGGKGKKVSTLLPLIPPHKTYVEVFGGGASLLFAKKPSEVEVYNDIDSGLVNLFRVLRDEEKFEKFYRRVSLTPYSCEEFYYCKETWQSCEDDIERAYRFYIVCRQSFGANNYSWGYSISTTAGEMSTLTYRWLKAINNLPEIHKRLMQVQIEHNDFRKIIETYDTPDTFFYLDPPYLAETRRGGGYEYEMSNEDHEDLVNLLLDIKGKALLSGYTNHIYKKLEDSGWNREDYDVACHAVGKTRETGILGERATFEKNQRRTESVWFNYELRQKTLF